MDVSIIDALPDIPRVYTGIAEWLACLVYVLVVPGRLRGPLIYIGLALAGPAMVALQIFIDTWPLQLWIVGMVLAMGLMYGVIYFGTRASWRAVIYLTCRAFVLAELVASFQWQLEVHDSPHFLPSTVGEHWQAGIALFVVCYAGLFGAAYLLEKRNYPSQVHVDVDIRSMVLSVAIAAITFLVSNLSFISSSSPFSATIGRDIFYIRTLVDFAGLVALYSQQSTRNMMREAVEIATMKTMLAAQQEQYMQSKRNIEELNRMHHDLKHYAAAIRAEGDAGRREKYVQALEDTVTGYESEVVTGNTVLDVLLSSKKELCLSKGITFTLMADGRALAFMDAMDTAAFFGNALDNAIEASERVPESEKRTIKVDIHRQYGFAVVSIENYFPWPVYFVGRGPRTTKRDAHRHGFGTVTMRKVAERYHGKLTLSHEEKWFRVLFVVPVPMPVTHSGEGEGTPAQ